MKQRIERPYRNMNITSKRVLQNRFNGIDSTSMVDFLSLDTKNIPVGQVKSYSVLHGIKSAISAFHANIRLPETASLLITGSHADNYGFMQIPDQKMLQPFFW